MIVTIGIKALNEEKHIAASLASALEAAHPLAGEVILADSGSTDRTIKIASAFPVRIVQLANVSERSCGTGAQLAFQYALGEYFYLLDGDMVLDADFLKAGIEFLEANPTVAAVGGHVIECNIEAEEFQIRASSQSKDGRWRAGLVDRLDCGGLYRSRAVRDVGYFADRNLHSFEEFELAARLASRGWTLARIDHPAVDHFGHTGGGYRLLWRRLRSGYAGGAGEVLRSAIGRPHWSIVIRRLQHIRIGIVVMIWWAVVVASPFVSPWLTMAIVAAPIFFLSVRRASLRLGLFSLAQWNVGAIGLLTGFVRPRRAATAPIEAVDLSPRANVRSW
jgi:GT2 family glycosyltransferase